MSQIPPPISGSSISFGRILSTNLLNTTYNDNGNPGWYSSTNTDTDKPILRLSDISTIDFTNQNSTTGATGINALTGMIGYSSTDGNFYGYSSGGPTGTSGWTVLTSATGPTGPTGANFENQVNFINTQNDSTQMNIISSANIFITSSINPTINETNVYIRTIEGGTGNYNGYTTKLLNVYQNNNTIALNPSYIPYISNFSGSNSSNTYLSGFYNPDPLNTAYTELRCFGQKELWTANANIIAGQAVTLISVSNQLQIIPLTYNPNYQLNFNTCPTLYGIALSNTTAGSNCNVCIKGITSVLCNTNVSSFDVANIATSVGSPGYVGPSGFIFHPSQPTSYLSLPIDYIRCGFFMANGATVASTGNYALFNVDIKHSAF